MRIHRHQRNLSFRSFLNFGFVFVLSDLDAFRPQLLYLLINQLHARFHRLRCRPLKLRIKRRINPVRLVVHLPLIELADQRLTHQIDEVRRIAGFNIRRGQLQWRSFSLLCISFCDGVCLDHAVEHQVAAFQRALRMPIRRQIAGRLNQSSDQRRFRHGNIFQVLVEVRSRSLSKPADCERATLSKINPVGVKLEDLLLGEFLLHLHRDQHFRQFPLHRFLRRQEKCPRKLHRDSGAALLVALMG